MASMMTNAKIQTEVALTLIETIKAMGAAINVTYQQITQSIDSRIPDIDDETFQLIIEESKRQVEIAKNAWMAANCHN